MIDNIIKVLKQFKRDVSKALGNELVEVILYGSYGRGDYTDVDILIINRK